MKNDNKGFSLIELIVVIAIMAILVGVMAPQVIKYIESSRQSTDIQNAAAIRSAVEVGVTEGTITGNVTVAVDLTTTPHTLTVSGDGTAAALAAVGLPSSVNLKSSGWKTGTVGSYSITNYKWTATANENNNEPKRKISSAFE